jgi:hypothetical protein
MILMSPLMDLSKWNITPNARHLIVFVIVCELHSSHNPFAARPKLAADYFALLIS